MKAAVAAACCGLGRAIINQFKDRISEDQIVGSARKVEKAKDLGVEDRNFYILIV